MPNPDMDWKAAWSAVADRLDDAAGTPSDVTWGADAVEPGALRRFLEPLEFDCALHTDAQVARAQGYPDVVAPCASLMSFAFPPIWAPGETQFTSPARNAQPPRLSVKPRVPEGAPATSEFFVVESSSDYLRPVVAGDRIGRRVPRLVACAPKETRVGRGAFCTYVTEVVNQRGEIVARVTSTMYLYNPHPETSA